MTQQQQHQLIQSTPTHHSLLTLSFRLDRWQMMRGRFPTVRTPQERKLPAISTLLSRHILEWPSRDKVHWPQCLPNLFYCALNNLLHCATCSGLVCMKFILLCVKKMYFPILHISAPVYTNLFYCVWNNLFHCATCFGPGLSQIYFTVSTVLVFCQLQFVTQWQYKDRKIKTNVSRMFP